MPEPKSLKRYNGLPPHAVRSEIFFNLKIKFGVTITMAHLKQLTAKCVMHEV